MLPSRLICRAVGPYAAPVTVEYRGDLRIETRGQVCAGWRSISHLSHNS